MKKKNFKKVIFKIIILIVVLVVGILIGKNINLGAVNASTTSETTSEVVSVDVGTQDIQNTITSSGEITASETEKVYLTSGKYFSQMCVETNDTVKAGENILKYSNGTYLTAEYDCVISTYSVPSTGEVCTSDNYVEVKNVSKLDMTLSVDESEINNVKVGQEVEIKLNAFDDKTYTGTITKIDSVGTYATSGTSFTATVELENDGNAKIGMSATCTIIIADEKGVVAVPIAAVQTSGDKKYVVLVNDDGTTTNVDVETGISNDSYVQILSGITAGQKIQMVQITSTKSNMSGNRGTMPSGTNMGNFGTGSSTKSTTSQSSGTTTGK